MAITEFTLMDSTLTPASAGAGGIPANGQYLLYQSPVQSNVGGFTGIRLVAEYAALANAGATVPADLQGGIGVLVEVLNSSKWLPVAYQFESYRNDQNGQMRIIQLEPEISTFSDGIDSIVYVTDMTVARVSRQQGRLGSSYRVKVLLSEQGYGTQYAFASVGLKLYGEVY